MKTRYLAILATLAFLLLYHANVAHAQSVTTEYVCLRNCGAGDTVSTSVSLQSGTLTGIGTEIVLVQSLTLQFSNNPSLAQMACQSPSAPPDCVNVIVPGAPPYVAGTLTAIYHDGVFAGFKSVDHGGGVQVEIRPTNNIFGEGISLDHGLGGDVLIHYPCCAGQPIYVETSQVIVLDDSDGDGVPDDQDICPNTAPGDEVDATGCPTNSPPIANAGSDNVTDAPDSRVLLDGSLSSDIDGDPLTYSWTVPSQPVDGNATLITGGGFSGLAEFTVEKEGDYIFQLIVNDGQEDSVPDTVKVTVAGDLILVSAQPIQAVEGVSALVLDKFTVFKAVIENTSPEDKTLFVSVFLDDTAFVSADEILVKGGCTATYYFPNPADPIACDGKHLPSSTLYTPKSSVIGAGPRNLTIQLDSANQVVEINEGNNELVSLHRWTQTNDLVILYVPIIYFRPLMREACLAGQILDFQFCMPNLTRILSPIQWVDLVYPVDDIKYIQLPIYFSFHPRTPTRTRTGVVFNNIGALWGDLAELKRLWVRDNPGANREVVLYGWLPTNTIKNGWGNSGTKLGFGDENLGSIGICPTCEDMHINDILLAHEVGHMLSVKHPTDEKRVPECDGFNAPYTSITINQQGYHIPSGHTKAPAIREHMMGGHCPGLGVTIREEKWTSPEGWDNLIQLMAGNIADVPPAASVPATPGALAQDTMIVSGTISTDGSFGQLDPIYQSMLTADVTDGQFTLLVLDSASNVLHMQDFGTADLENIIPEGEPEDLEFFLISPFPEGTDSIHILNGAFFLASIYVSPNSPIVFVLFPNSGETLSGFQTIRWDGSDADGDELFYKVEYSFDVGTSWNLIAKNIATTFLDVSFDQLPGNGNTALIRVTATDGINTSSDTSDGPFVVANKPPRVVIIRPETDSEIASDDGVSLQGEAADVEDGAPPPDSSFGWSSSIDGVLGSGRTLDPGILSAGVHLITLAVTDNDGLQGTSIIKLFVDVEPLEIIDGFSARGQRSDVNEFLTYDNPRESSTPLPSGTTSFDLRLEYRESVLPNSFSAVLNNVDITSMFHPFAGFAEQVTLDLQDGRNVLILTIDGVRTDGRTVTERDRLVFVVK